MALSMLGYRCCSDVTELPELEHNSLFAGAARRIFDAYVNVGSLATRFCQLLALYPNARVIVTVLDANECTEDCYAESDKQGLASNPRAASPTTAELVRQLRQLSANILVLPTTEKHKWKTLSLYLGCGSPATPYPVVADQGRRRLSAAKSTERRHHNDFRRLQFDSSPWIAVPTKRWRGISCDEVMVASPGAERPADERRHPSVAGASPWRLLDDTFPSNLALFRSGNFAITPDNTAVLALRKEGVYVRDYTSASLCSSASYRYGRFEAVIRPTGIPGVITGMFFHRNSPRQEIDIEFLGRDTTKVLANVYYNPGGEGARFDYGYRGTPVLIDLGFDAAGDFHSYAIDWSPTVLRWFVDGRVVHERANWDPTPIPHLPMNFYINLWPSRSKRLVGRLSDGDLPAHSRVKLVNHAGVRWPWP